MSDNGTVKTLDPKLASRSVIELPTLAEDSEPRASPLILTVAALSQSIKAWGTFPRLRDKELRAFWPTEPWLASVVYLVSIRNASFAWEVVGSNPAKPFPKNTANMVRKILKKSDGGRGWQSLIIKTCIDLYTQDNGAFWEVIRRSPTSPVINIRHLDAGRCQRTGNPKWPVIYTDRNGKEHALKYWQVRTIEEMPSPIEDAYNLQYCAVSRALLAAEIIQSIAVYKNEKVSGKFTRAIDFVSGVTRNNIDDATALSEEQNINRGLYRYSLPIIIPGIDPGSTLSHVHIDLASLPENFDEDASLRWYVAQLAASFGVDYQEIAPLMSGNLGSSQQSEIMHLKTRGKGPAMIMSLLEDVINDGLIPDNVEFKFLEQDVRSEAEKAEASFTRAKERSLRVKSGEIDTIAARELAIEVGDLPLWLSEEVNQREEELGDEMGGAEEREREEFQAEQIEGGISSQNERKIAFDYVDAIRQEISISPDKFLQNRIKASIGNPAGTVIAKVFSNSHILQLQRQLMLRYKDNAQAVFSPAGTFHITMVHAGLVEDFDFNVISSDIALDMPQSVLASKLSFFDTPNGKALILKIDENSRLKEAQFALYRRFEQHNVITSEFSHPNDWQPHITLGYVDAQDVDEFVLEMPVVLELGDVHFTRSEHYNVHTIYTDMVGSNALDN